MSLEASVPKTDWNLSIGIASLVFSVVTTTFIGYLSFLMLRFSAKPRLRIYLVGNKEGIAFLPGRPVTLKVHLENVGYWYGKPIARNTRAFWNFDPSFELRQIRFGSDLAKSESNVRKGKAGCKFLRADGIHLSVGEPGEYIEAEVVTPPRPGWYRTWVSAFCDEGDCGVHEFTIEIR